MSSYRPDDWEDNKPFFHVSRSKEYCYESGADAILEALRKDGIQVDGTKAINHDELIMKLFVFATDTEMVSMGNKGKLVFIPD